MPDKKLTDSEIKKALRSWLEEIRKSRQAYAENVGEEHYPSMRYEYLLSDTIHAINRLQADCESYKQVAEYQQSVTMDKSFKIKRLTEKVNSLQAENEKNENIIRLADKTIETANAEIERLKEEKSKLENKIDEMYPLVMQLTNAMQQAKAEAYKEFAEKLKDEYTERFLVSGDVLIETIDNLLKEIIGE